MGFCSFCEYRGWFDGTSISFGAFTCCLSRLLERKETNGSSAANGAYERQISISNAIYMSTFTRASTMWVPHLLWFLLAYQLSRRYAQGCHGVLNYLHKVLAIRT